MMICTVRFHNREQYVILRMNVIYIPVFYIINADMTCLSYQYIMSPGVIGH